ncbi:phosphotransferase [Robertmurraya korlensis]|uniref:phosphotransferase enzyme family protein n=1 Tax=Robertmurraya korlensis TaxID=519977 RepID=UPI0020401DD3|nr:phosphotransferase [Robertmurraya korlensis]MCM3599980.1 phosphotransferase [Robertmurraya korlensis]
MTRHLIIEKIKTYYGNENTEYHWISDGFQNIVIKCTHPSRTIFVRVAASGRRTMDMLKAEIDWLFTLSKASLHVPTALPSHLGNLIEKIFIEDTPYYLVAFHEVMGEPLDVTNKIIWNTQLFKEWGAVLGCIHRTTPNKLLYRPNQWEASSTVMETINYFARNENEDKNDRLQEIVHEISKLPTDPEVFGLIHNDFHQGNIIIQPQGIGVIDFDDCMYGWYAQDISVALYHAYWQATEIAKLDSSFSIAFLDTFIQGYKKSYTLSHDTIKLIPLFVRWREFFLYALFMKKWSLHALQDWQSYTLKMLRNRILNGETYIPNI